MICSIITCLSLVVGPEAHGLQPVGLVRFEFSQPHMGTLFKIVLYAPDQAKATKASDAAFARIARLDQSMSDYKPDSELMTLCRQAGGPPVKVSEELFFVLAESQKLAKQTDGAFDVTVGPVVELWRRARRQHELPKPERLAQALELVGNDKLRLDKKNRTAQLLRKGMKLDLGAIAKGYAADEAMAVLKQHDVKSALVAAGGDIVVSAPPPDKEGWTIAIGPQGKNDLPVLLLHDAAVSTSGDIEQYVEIDGRRYSHIVDPKTGIGLVGSSRVTVVAPKGIISDGLDTAVSVLGPKRGLELIDSKEGTAAIIVQGNGRRFESKRWKEVPKKNGSQP